MSAPLAIRAATKADASEVALLVNIATHGGIGFGWAHDEQAKDTYDPIEVGRVEMLDESDSLNWRNATLAESDGEVVGLLLGYREPESMPPMPANIPAFLVPIIELEWLTAGRWFISMLAVHFGWRDKGIGTRLLEVAERKRGESAARGMALITEDGNAGARQLYERMGFAVQATRPMRSYPDGTAPGKNWLLMVKE